MAFTVTYTEMDGWPRGGWQAGEFDAERMIRVAWTDRAQFLAELDTYPNNQYPYADGPADAIVRRVKTIPFGASTAASGSSLASYEYALIQVWHSTRGPVWNTLLSCLVQENLFPAPQLKFVSRQNLRWKSDNKEVLASDEPQLDDTLYEYVVSFSRLLTLPAWVLTRPGVCNSNSVAILLNPTLGTWALTMQPETLKYNGCEISGKWSLGLVARWNVTASFLFKGSKWNWYWRPDGGPLQQGGWEQMVTKTGADYIQHTPVPISLL